MIQGIYCIENIASGRKYFGCSKNVVNRLKQHRTGLEKRTHHNIQLQRSFNKHGIDTFKFYLVEETHYLLKIELQEYEQTFIDANVGGYNMAPANGGDTLSNHPNKVKIRNQILESHSQMVTALSKEERALKWGRTGADNPNWRDDVISNKLCPICNTNKILSISKTCSKCRNKAGDNNPFFGRHHTEKTKQKLRDRSFDWIRGIDPAKLSYTKKYQIIYPNGNIKEVAGLKIIATEFNVSIENVHATIKRIKKGNAPKKGAFVNVIIKEIT